PVIEGGVRVGLSSTEIVNGGALLVTVGMPASIPAATLRVHAMGKEHPLFPSPEGEQPADRIMAGDAAVVRHAFIGIPFRQKLGDAKVVVRAGKGPKAIKVEVPFRVIDGDYVVESLKVDPKHV